MLRQAIGFIACLLARASGHFPCAEAAVIQVPASGFRRDYARAGTNLMGVVRIVVYRGSGLLAFRCIRRYLVAFLIQGRL